MQQGAGGRRTTARKRHRMRKGVYKDFKDGGKVLPKQESPDTESLQRVPEVLSLTSESTEENGTRAPPA